MGRKDKSDKASDVRQGLAARLVAAELLGRIVDDHAIADVLTNERNGAAGWLALPVRDRALARAITMTALRHRGQIEAALGRLVDRPPPKRARHLLNCLHVAAAQILFMEVPDSAAVNLGVAAVGENGRTARFAGFANAVLRRMGREKEALLVAPRGARTVFPEWLGRRLIRDHGRQKADAIAAIVTLEPYVDLTPHPRLSRQETDHLATETDGLRLTTGSLRIPGQQPVAALPGFGEGHWWVQDAAASLPARLLGDVGGLEVADLCAAPGGKTLQLAAAGARVTAVDISGARLERLKENLARTALGAEIVEADILEWRPGRQFDAVLLDAPCSATGTMRRHPDIIWNRTPGDVESLVDLQKRLLAAATGMVRPGGLLVYANCSILKAEGEDRLAAIKSELPQLQHLALTPDEFPVMREWIDGQGALRTLPCDLPHDGFAGPAWQGGMDGFFACRFRVSR